MNIIYKFTATDDTYEESSLSLDTHSHSIYPWSFVADCSYSPLPVWESNGK